MKSSQYSPEQEFFKAITRLGRVFDTVRDETKAYEALNSEMTEEIKRRGRLICKLQRRLRRKGRKIKSMTAFVRQIRYQLKYGKVTPAASERYWVNRVAEMNQKIVLLTEENDRLRARNEELAADNADYIKAWPVSYNVGSMEPDFIAQHKTEAQQVLLDAYRNSFLKISHRGADLP